MQGIGGVKGANNDGFDYIKCVSSPVLIQPHDSNIPSYLAQLAYQTGTPEQQAWANWTALTDLTLLPTNRSTGTSVNVRDNILPANLDEGLPAQFVYEPADCRLFYTPAMITDVTAQWKAAADAAFYGGACVNGGLSNGTTAARRRSVASAVGKGSGSVGARGMQRREVPAFEPLEEYAWRSSVHGEKVPS